MEVKIADTPVGKVWLALVFELSHIGGVCSAGMASEGTACEGRTSTTCVVESSLLAHHRPVMVFKTAVAVKILGIVGLNYCIGHA